MADNGYDILGIGAAIIDQIIHVSEDFLAAIPGRKGGMEPIDELTYQQIMSIAPETPCAVPGGSAANVIRGLASLDHPCAFISRIGTDSAGKYFAEDLRQKKIVDLCTQFPGHTAQVISLVTPDGQRTCRSYLGVAKGMEIQDLDRARISRAKAIHIEGYTLDYNQLTQLAMTYAKESGAKVSFDLASFEIVERHKPALLNLIEGAVDILFSNEAEAKALTGFSPELACRELQKLCPVVIVSINKEGCWVGSKGIVQHCPAFPVEALDSTGAGDLFAAGFLHGIIKNKPLEICANYGALLGAEAVQVEGAILPTERWNMIRKQL